MRLIQADNKSEAKRLLEEIRDKYSWTDGSMEVDAVELLTLSQEYVDAMGDIDKETLLARYWSDDALV